MRRGVDWQGFWQRRGWGNVLLLSLAFLFGLIVAVRRRWWRWCAPPRYKIPVVVVGGISSGGSGKTPFVIALVCALQKAGYQPGVVSRGYGRQQQLGGDNAEIVDVNATNAALRYGDEPLLIARKTHAIVCVATDRRAAVVHLQDCGCDVVVSDDGLQHYAMHRDVEVALVSGRYGMGNGWLLPAGPLREPVSRLRDCTLRVVVGSEKEITKPSPAKFPADFTVQEETDGFYFLHEPDNRLPATAFVGKRVVAVCGLAHPQAFFDRLKSLGIALAATHALPDHTRLPPARLQAAAATADTLMMTEKDAVKYGGEADAAARIAVLAVRHSLPEPLTAIITQQLQNFYGR